MYKISHAKCVCFLFLVIISVLSCSGFRIDSIAMTDISKRNFHTSISLTNPSDFTTIITDDNNRQQQQQQINPSSYGGHRIRHHHRQSRSHHHNNNNNNNKPLEMHSHSKTRATSSKTQNKEDKKQQQKLALQKEIAWKVYASNTVVIGQVSIVGDENCTYIFKVLKIIKDNKLFVDRNQLKLNFERQGDQCVVLDYPEYPDRLTAVNLEFKKYVLFFNSSEGHIYRPVGTPIRNKNEQFIRNTLRNTFRPLRATLKEKPSNSSTNSSRKRRKIICTANGYPTPYISWKLNDSDLNLTSVKIVDRNKKNTVRSTLVIKSDTPFGTYKCIARGPNRTIAREKKIEDTSLSEKRGEPCGEGFKDLYCYNGGTCFLLPLIREYSCVCAEGFAGNKCEKVSSHISTYDEDNNYPCKLGLTTKYNC